MIHLGLCTDAGYYRLFNFVSFLLLLWIIEINSIKEISISHVVAIVGDRTYLPCDISTTDEEDSVHLVIWYREDLGTSVYSIDAREYGFGFAERWSDHSVFSNRAYFNSDKKPAGLEVDHVREEDTGIYRCRVDFQIGQTRNSKINLTVIIPPHKIVIKNENGVAKNSKVGPYMEGDTLRLSCDVYGGKPGPTVTWYYENDNFLLNKVVKVYKRDGLIRSEIEIKNLGRANVHAKLTCNATNNNRSFPLSSTVRVDMNFGPIEVHIINADQSLSSGKKYDLICVTSGSRPPAIVSWWMNGERFFNSRENISSDGNITTSVLSFLPSEEDAGRSLSCRAENPIMISSTIEDTWILKVQYVPKTRVKLGTSLNPDMIREGTDVYFDCLIQADPPFYNVEWMHQGKKIHHNISLGIVIINQSLVLQGVDRKSAGNYTCVGYNTEGRGASEPYYLNVMFAPTCKQNQMKVYGVGKQERANISCEVEANPLDIEFHWTFNNSAENIDIASGHTVRVATSSILSYTPINELDYGTILCWASNKIGHQQVPCVFYIIPAGRPDMVHNCTIANTSSYSFSVKCAEGFNGGLPQSFLLEVRETNSQELRVNLSSSVPRFRIKNLDSGVLYQACVYAYNEKGRSEPSVVQAETLRLPEKQLTFREETSRYQLKLTPMLSIIIGVVAALVIVVVIVTVVLKFQHSCVNEQKKLHIENHDETTKADFSHGELCFKEDSDMVKNEKNPSNPIEELDLCGSVCENDERNPDIIPQRITGDKSSDYLRKQKLISTIDTLPARNTNSYTSSSINTHGNHVGYCTIGNGLPLCKLSNIPIMQNNKSFKPVVNGVHQIGMRTLPKQHWSSGSVHSMTMGRMNPSVMYTGMNIRNRICQGSSIINQPKEVKVRIPSPFYIQFQKNTSLDTPTVLSKRESSV